MDRTPTLSGPIGARNVATPFLICQDAVRATCEVESLIVDAERGGRQRWVELLPQLVAQIERLPESKGLAVLARAHDALGNKDEAVKAAQRALALDPNARLAYGPSMLLARACAQAGKWKEAVPHCQAALAACPGDSEAREIMIRAEGNSQCNNDALRMMMRSAQGVGPSKFDSGSRDWQSLKAFTSTAASSNGSERSGSAGRREEPDDLSYRESDYDRRRLPDPVATAAEYSRRYSKSPERRHVDSVSRFTPSMRGDGLGRDRSEFVRSHQRSPEPSLRYNDLDHSLRGPAARILEQSTNNTAVRQQETMGVKLSSAALAVKEFSQRTKGEGTVECRSYIQGDMLSQTCPGAVIAAARGAQERPPLLQPTPVLQAPPRRTRSPLRHGLEAIAEAARPSMERPSTEHPCRLLSPTDLELGQFLRAGTFGLVYRGTLRGAPVIIERFPAEVERLQDLCDEVAALSAQLRHPRLVYCLGLCRDSSQEPSLVGRICVAWEDAGQTLHSWLHELRRPLVSAERLAVAADAAEGIAYLHGLHPAFVHGHLRSGNVLLARGGSASNGEGEGLRARLSDVGLKQAMERTGLSANAASGAGGSAEGDIAAARYMSPELLDHMDSAFTETIDVWAMGCIIGELFTGRLPNDWCASVQEVAARISVKRQLPFREWDGLSSALLSLTDACFEYSAARRIGSARLRDELAALRASARPA
eukprot:TRINITY_DN948_c0_g1_i2.p1 TRINITY_DN948_c0_g1~~TRINITY_DN948_c0_g1_i2.p1  ORF type:complete len:720 (-),score=121.59 TRINITY_DN948_c0_g1_i2:164-2284(-)